MKSDADAYIIDDLQKKKVDSWDGVRNYQARNFMMLMEVGDKVLFYHSGKEPGIYGLAKVTKKAHPDESQFNKKNPHFDPKATKEKPVWQCVDVTFVRKLKNPIPLVQLKADPNLKGMRVRENFSRLSVQPVSESHYIYILSKLTQ